MSGEAWGATSVKWTPYKARTRALCGDCTTLIHQHGQGGAPLPQRAHWRRKGPLGETLHCNEHAEERKRYDTRADALAKSRTEISEHEAKARRSRVA